MLPGMCFIVFGALLGGLLALGPLRLEDNVVLDLDSFIAACFMIVVGTQLITFSIISRYYATVTGILPDSRSARALVEHVTTDRLVWLAVAFIISGVTLFGLAFSFWARGGFGPITTPFAPRSAAAGLTAIVIGLQTFFSAFFLGVLTIPMQRSTHGANYPEI
jgi:hypothetical protein